MLSAIRYDQCTKGWLQPTSATAQCVVIGKWTFHTSNCFESFDCIRCYSNCPPWGDWICHVIMLNEMSVCSGWVLSNHLYSPCFGWLLWLHIEPCRSRASLLRKVGTQYLLWALRESSHTFNISSDPTCHQFLVAMYRAVTFVCCSHHFVL